MAHLYRVRRATFKGPVVVCHTAQLAQALRTARLLARQSGKAVRVERKVHPGWETVTLVQPPVQNPVEEALARGVLPRVADAAGNRQGRIRSFVRPTRECWVVWDGAEEAAAEKVAVDALQLIG